MARRTRAWTVDKQNHTCAGKERVVVVNKINGEIKNAPKIFYLFILIFHNQTMATNVKRPVPNRTVLLVCDIQVKFSEFFSSTERPESSLTMSSTGDAIYGFEEVVATANKMLKIAKVLARRTSF